MIREVYMEDFGEYVCVAENIGGSETSTVFIKVYSELQHFFLVFPSFVCSFINFVYSFINFVCSFFNFVCSYFQFSSLFIFLSFIFIHFKVLSLFFL